MSCTSLCTELPRGKVSAVTHEAFMNRECLGPVVCKRTQTSAFGLAHTKGRVLFFSISLSICAQTRDQNEQMKPNPCSQLLFPSRCLCGTAFSTQPLLKPHEPAGLWLPRSGALLRSVPGCGRLCLRLRAHSRQPSHSWPWACSEGAAQALTKLWQPQMCKYG